MTDAEIRLGCLDLAVQINKPQGNYLPDAIVSTAKALYTFTQASAEPEAKPLETPLIVDKAKVGKPVKSKDQADILS